MEPVHLSDGVVRLSPFGLAHARAHLAGEDAELVRWLNGGPGTPDGVAAYARRCERCWADGADPRAFAITVGGTGEQAGYIDLRFRAEYITAGEVNVSYGIYPQWRGRGLVTRAVRLVCEYAGREGARWAVIRTDPGNRRSADVARRAGFRFDRRVVESGGEVFDRHLLDLASGGVVPGADDRPS